MSQFEERAAALGLNVVDVIGPILHPCGGRLYRYMPEINTDAVKLAGGKTLTTQLQQVAQTLATKSDIKFVDTILQRDLLQNLMPGDRVFVADASLDPQVAQASMPAGVLYLYTADETWAMISAAAAERYDIGEIYTFLNPGLKPGMAPATGGLIANVDQRFPDAWEYFQTAQGQTMCVDEDAWQDMNTAVYATLADGTELSWDGIGGAPAYVLDVAAKTLRLPDLRGMFAETPGGPGSPEVGRAKAEGVANIKGTLGSIFVANGGPASVTNQGAFKFIQGSGNYSDLSSGTSYKNADVTFQASRVAPTAAITRPRAYGLLTCCFLGKEVI